MKIGVLTFHCAHNYGAVLQAYALQEHLKSLGHHVEIIDYRPDYLLAPYKSFKTYKSLLKRFGQFPWLPSRILRQKRFSHFISRKLELSRGLQADAFAGNRYDAYILGSDQIWNFRITRGDMTFLGVFDRPAESRLISYAASTEVSHEGGGVDYAAEKQFLEKFSAISVREDLLRDQIQPLVDTTVFTVLDPTLLVDPVAFEGITERTRDSGFLLVYQVKRDANITLYSKKIMEKENISYNIELIPSVERKDLLNPYAAASPGAFLHLFKTANFVVTTSFHGTVFSIIFRKQFVCVMNKTRGNYRISSLLKKLGIEDRMVYTVDEVPDQLIDYDVVSKRLEILRKESREFIAAALAEK